MRFMFSILLVLISFAFIPTPVSAEVCGVYHRKVGEKCVEFEVPSNAHLTWSGNWWDCNRGFKMSEDRQGCVEIKVPSNASANTIGSYFCNSGYKRVGDECEKVPEVPNGRFYSFGADFYCLKGYLRNEETRKCEKIIIPENAREDDSALSGWICFSGYLKDGDHCKKFELPEHSFWEGNYFKCIEGYKKNYHNNTCEKIFLPENAIPADTFDGWRCKDGFTKNYKENKCDKQTS